jgi:hypothetical protein
MKIIFNNLNSKKKKKKKDYNYKIFKKNLFLIFFDK